MRCRYCLPMVRLFRLLLAGALGGGLGGGIAILTAPDSIEVQASAAALGAGVGLWWGFKAFYQKVVVELGE